MRTRKIINSLVGAMALAGVVACSDDDDNGLDSQDPSITISEPVEDQSYEPGGEVHLEALLEDDIALASYKIDVHNDFDGHTHRPGPVSLQESEPWSLNQTGTIEGGATSYELHQHLEIPTSATEGAYHVGIVAVDDAGNQTEAYVRIVVGEAHGGEEHITITGLSVEDTSPGGELHAEADLTSEHSIATVNVSIHGHDLTPAADEIEWEFDQNYTDYSGTSVEFHEHIGVPANATPGEYHMTLTVIDDEGNSHAEGAHFHIE